jgi:aminopeptidase-like protein
MIGKEIHDFATELWPVNRSITGEGVRQTLNMIRKYIPDMRIKSIKSGASAFDWTIPKEWSVKEAYIISPEGEKICDFSKNNLHLLGYSIPFTGKVDLSELKEHLYTAPDQPNAIPYITSFYSERWGFCLSQNDFDELTEGIYEVFIDAKFFEGILNYGELLIEGKSKKEIFLSSYVCHPSMANNELSGPTVLTFIAKWIRQMEKTEYSYRIVFVPETIGSISYLSINYKKMKKDIIAGFNLTCLGDERCYSYLPSRNGLTISDYVAKHVLKWTDPNYISYSWLDRGSDERQYCAPGIDLPVASIMRSKYVEYPEYHTSLDDLEQVVTPKGLDGGYWIIRKALEAIEKNKVYDSVYLCEPQMGKRGLYSTLSIKNNYDQVKLMMDLISFCDGKTTLLEIANMLNIPIWDLYELVDKLKSHNLIYQKI